MQSAANNNNGVGDFYKTLLEVRERERRERERREREDSERGEREREVGERQQVTSPDQQATKNNGVGDFYKTLPEVRHTIGS